MVTPDFAVEKTSCTAYRSMEFDRIFGYAEPLPQWTLEMFRQHVLPEYRADVEAAFREGPAARAGWAYECRIRRADGEIRWIWFSGRLAADDSGRIRMVGVVVQDITDRKRAEERLRASLAGQMHGTVQTGSGPGTEFRLGFNIKGIPS